MNRPKFEAQKASVIISAEFRWRRWSWRLVSKTIATA